VRSLGAVDEISTPRLRLRRFRPDDVHEFRRFAVSDDYRRYLSADHPDVEEFVENNLGERGDSLAFVIELDGVVIGSVFLGVDRAPPGGELACLLDPAHWQRGFGREACRALIEHAFTDRLVDRVWARADPDNAASIRGLESLGMRPEHANRIEGHGVVYTIDAPRT